jgi:hypothetical protein
MEEATKRDARISERGVINNWKRFEKQLRKRRDSIESDGRIK